MNLGTSLYESKMEKGFISFKVWDKDSITYQKKYCVATGFYSVENLYEASQPVQSQSNRFSDPMNLS
jgi:hypothetical protein